MSEVLPWIQILLSVLLIFFILLQHAESGLEGAIGGGSFDGGHHQTRRGFEKFTFVATIVVAILFATTSLLSLVF